MEFENIIYEVRDGIAYVTVNRPKVLNALNDQTMEELKQHFWIFAIGMMFEARFLPAPEKKHSLPVQISMN